jgi:hypothetical protein
MNGRKNPTKIKIHKQTNQPLETLPARRAGGGSELEKSQEIINDIV